MSNPTNSFRPWEDLSDSEKKNFADMLNRRFGAGVTVAEAEEYYGNREKAEEEFGDIGQTKAPECPECFTPLYKEDIPHLKRTGRCPACGEVLLS